MEKERTELQREIEELEQRLSKMSDYATSAEDELELSQLRARVERLEHQVMPVMTAMDRVKLARHPDRPQTLDFVKLLFEDFSEIHGDRRFANDPAIVCGMAKFHGQPVLIIGHQRGHDFKQRQFRNFGMPKPEGYRKAIRTMAFAAKFGRPIFTFIDTTGAFPGIDAEERGQAEAIAYNLREMARLPVPIIVTITGEGGSGGALAIGVGDIVNMFENAVYSVISPEGCAAILWKDRAKADRAAEVLKLTAQDLLQLGVIDHVIPEPTGGGHLDHRQMAVRLDECLTKSLAALTGLSVKELLDRRYKKFRAMGEFIELEVRATAPSPNE